MQLLRTLKLDSLDYNMLFNIRIFNICIKKFIQIKL